MNKIEKLIEELCPEGIKYKPLREICKIETGRLNASEGSEDGRFTFFTTAKIPSRIDSYRWDTEALLIAGNANVGNVQYFSGKFEAYQRTYVLTEFPRDLNVRFLYFALRTSLDAYLNSNKNVSAMTYIVLSTLENFEVPLPPIKVQEEIVSILDKFTEIEAELEAQLEAELRARANQFKHFRLELLGFNDEYDSNPLRSLIRELSPEGVAEFRISDFAKCVAGATPNSTVTSYWENGTIPWMSSGEVNKGTVFQTDKFITEEGFQSSSTKMLPINTVVMALAGQGKTRGMVARTRIPLCTNQSLCGIIPDSSVDPDYLYHFLKSKYRELRNMSSGEGGRGGLNLEIVRSVVVPVPPIQVQQAIASTLEKFSGLISDIETDLPAEITVRRQQYEYYRKKLLTFKELKAS
jgi:type I restriction enzyme S subunit